MKYEKELGADFDIALSEDHIRKKEKRYISMQRQKQHKQRFLLMFMSCRIVPVTSLQYGESVSGIVISRNIFIQTGSSGAKEAVHKNV